MTNLNSIRMALETYKADQGGYPPALLGYASLYATGPFTGQVVPADMAVGFLYPRRVSIEELKPRPNRAENRDFTKANWPNQDQRAPGSAPIVDNNGDGRIDASDDPADARQQYGPADGFVKRNLSASDIGQATARGIEPNIDAETVPGSINAQFYNVSGYDVASVPLPSGATRTELRYALFWSTWGLGGGNSQDDPRQLGYADPPESTVVTWNSFYRDYRDGVPERRRRDIVLFLGGGARSYDSRDLNERSWRVMP